jgi:hypothetical protein
MPPLSASIEPIREEALEAHLFDSNALVPRSHRILVSGVQRDTRQVRPRTTVDVHAEANTRGVYLAAVCLTGLTPACARHSPELFSGVFTMSFIIDLICQSAQKLAYVERP